MTRVRTRLMLAAPIAVVVLAVGYWAADSHALFGPTIHLRNEMASPAFVIVAGDRYDGDDKMSVPAWKAGMCATGTWTWHHTGNPTAAGGTTVFPSSATEITLTPLSGGDSLYVRIDSTGAVHTGESVPDNGPGCAGYAISDGWVWWSGGGIP